MPLNSEDSVICGCSGLVDCSFVADWSSSLRTLGQCCVAKVRLTVYAFILPLYASGRTSAPEYSLLV